MDQWKNKPNFKELLDKEYEWPCQYLFKFIVPKEKKPALEKLFPKHQLQFRASSGEKYLSLSVYVDVDSADLVIAIYEQAAQIPGLIAL